MNAIQFGLVLAALVGTSMGERCICPDNYEPVCGSDGITYPNVCELNCAAAVNQLVKLVRIGSCQLDNLVVDVPCPCNKEFAPVCGSDGRTYANPCLFDCKVTTTKNSALKIVYDGPCQAVPQAVPAGKECEIECEDGVFKAAPYGKECEIECENGLFKAAPYGKECEIECEDGVVRAVPYGKECEIECEDGLIRAVRPVQPVQPVQPVPYGKECEIECDEERP